MANALAVSTDAKKIAGQRRMQKECFAQTDPRGQDEHRKDGRVFTWN